MTDSLTGPVHAEDSALEHALAPHPKTPRSYSSFSAVNSMCQAASASRTSGRYAVGLRPILDPDASARHAQNLAEQPKRKDQPGKRGLARPRSYRDDRWTVWGRP